MSGPTVTETPPISAPPTNGAAPGVVLRRGDFNAQVGRLQRALNRRLERWKLPLLAVDDDYGPNTDLWCRRVCYGMGIAGRDWRRGLTQRGCDIVDGTVRRSPEEHARWVARRPWRARLRRRHRAGRPRLVTWSESGISPAPVFGQLGPETRVTTHYAASPRARSLADGIRLARQFDDFHRGKGWGGCSYHYLITDTGEILLGRSTLHRGAHVLNTNSSNIGINFFCTTGDEPTEAQKAAARWLLANAHTRRLPKAHRTDRPLTAADIRGHQDWPGQSTDCPGHFSPRNLGLR